MGKVVDSTEQIGQGKRPSYTPLSEDDLRRMEPPTLMNQYHMLVDWIRDHKGIPFERNPNVAPEQLIAGILGAQRSYQEDFHKEALLGALDSWVAEDPDRVVFVG